MIVLRWTALDDEEAGTRVPKGRLTQQDRRQIAAGLRDGQTYAAIGRRIGRPTSTVTREVMRNGGPGGYHADQAHRAGTRPVHRHPTTPPARSPKRTDLGGRDPRIVNGVAARTAELFVQTGLPPMMARVLATLLTTDSGSLTSAELVQRLRVSPASISKAVGYLEERAVVKRERDPHRRAERYVIDDDAWFQAIMAGARIDARIAAVSRNSARALDPTTPAGARLENLSRFLHHVSDDLVRSAEHWRQVYFTRPPAEVDDSPTA
ncbi:DNA-binding transcriptional regulator GbsR (MarR family) [Saccharothrix tamanrassetensis]|uniref:DNA-binding transcriptional regulator GbsR (MarR family) n=1 Tax=Saccharothrix tamanrassetensis TaxID=1051531 RepID=A0A841CFD2_9PSEU|nr:helix-turn-helix domain-containing protein [Saccharothrix tamanrassetensis]MBB5957252.1 DNA-binding transcriptional regulator GbsR (MarR family) [Saccharothrix tamanrassetensis]